MELTTERLRLANVISLALIQIFIIIVFAVIPVYGIYMAV